MNVPVRVPDCQAEVYSNLTSTPGGSFLCGTRLSRPGQVDMTHIVFIPPWELIGSPIPIPYIAFVRPPAFDSEIEKAGFRFPEREGRVLYCELVRDKAGGRSRSGAQIARNEAEVAKGTKLKREPQRFAAPRRRATRSRSAPVSVKALIRSSPGISSGKLAHLANSVSEKIEAGTAL